MPQNSSAWCNLYLPIFACTESTHSHTYVLSSPQVWQWHSKWMKTRTMRGKKPSLPWEIKMHWGYSWYTGTQCLLTTKRRDMFCFKISATQIQWKQMNSYILHRYVDFASFPYGWLSTQLFCMVVIQPSPKSGQKFKNYN